MIHPHLHAFQKTTINLSMYQIWRSSNSYARSIAFTSFVTRQPILSRLQAARGLHVIVEGLPLHRSGPRLDLRLLVRSALECNLDVNDHLLMQSYPTQFHHLAMRPQGLDALELAVAYHALEDGLHCRELVLLSDVLRQPSSLEVKLHINSKVCLYSLITAMA